MVIGTEGYVLALLYGSREDLAGIEGIHIVCAKAVDHLVPSVMVADLLRSIDEPVGQVAGRSNCKHQLAVFR